MTRAVARATAGKGNQMADNKYRVTMTNAIALADGEIGTHEAVDYVPADLLDAYVADARTRWQAVTVSDEVDHGPGGEDGPTHHPEHLKRGVTLQEHIESGEQR